MAGATPGVPLQAGAESLCDPLCGRQAGRASPRDDSEIPYGSPCYYQDGNVLPQNKKQKLARENLYGLAVCSGAGLLSWAEQKALLVPSQRFGASSRAQPGRFLGVPDAS